MSLLEAVVNENGGRTTCGRRAAPLQCGFTLARLRIAFNQATGDKVYHISKRGVFVNGFKYGVS